jgi:hypothetical protein
VQRVLKRDLLEGPRAGEWRNREPEGLEVEEVERVLERAEKLRDRRGVEVGPAAAGRLDLEALAVVERFVVRDLDQRANAAREEIPGLGATAAEGEDALLRDVTPAEIDQRAVVGVGAVRSDWDGRRGAQLDAFMHLGDLSWNLSHELDDRIRQVGDLEELLHVELLAPDVARIDVHQESSSKRHPGPAQDVTLKGDILVVDILHRSGALDLVEIPITVADWDQEVHATRGARVLEGRFVKRHATPEQLTRRRDRCAPVELLPIDLDAARKETLRQAAHELPLLEDRQRGLVVGRHELARPRLEPEALGALKPGEIARLRKQVAHLRGSPPDPVPESTGA